METCETCGKPRQIPTAEFRRWWFQDRSDRPFVPLRTFLADYCTCEQEITDDQRA